MLRDQIKRDIGNALEQLFVGREKLTDNQIEVFRPDNSDHGDYTSNVALRLLRFANGKRLKANSFGKAQDKHSPMEFAKELAGSLKSQPYIAKLEVKEPGFLNFFIKAGFFQKEVENVLKKGKFESQFTHQKVIVEFTDPNPFKEFHVGHLFSNSVGESISRLLEAVGAQVKRANYQGDVGLHVAKCIWGMREKVKREKGKEKSWQGLKSASIAERVEFLGSAYAAGASAFEQDAKAKEEIIELNKEIYEKTDKIEEYRLGKNWSLENFEAIYKRLGTKFDLYYFESEVGMDGAQIVGKNVGKVFQKSEGAVIFPGEKYGLHNRVFINSLGLPTYEAKELGLAFKKYEDFKYDDSIIVTGNEIVEYFKVLVKVLELIDSKLASGTHHVAHGMVRMPGGKISSRLGNVIGATGLIDEAKKRALALAKHREKGKSQSNDKIAEQVAVGAVKYAMLRGNVGQDIKFSYEEAMSLDGNSGPYLQYTHARCMSVLEKSERVKEGKSERVKERDSERVRELESGRLEFSASASEEKLLLRALGHFGETVVAAAEDFAPNQVAGFLFEVAQKYNNLYNNLRIIDSNEPDRSRRLFLTESTARVLEKGLNLLGISAPEKM